MRALDPRIHASPSRSKTVACCDTARIAGSSPAMTID
jgi:hypothetical protein